MIRIAETLLTSPAVTLPTETFFPPGLWLDNVPTGIRCAGASADLAEHRQDISRAQSQSSQDAGPDHAEPIFAL